MLTLLTLLLACASPPQQTHLPSLLACGDQLCQQEHLVAAWKEDPAAVTAYITGQQDELVRTALAGWVARALPGEVGQLCQALEQTTVAWFRCQRLNTRPHLRAEHDFEAVNRGMKHRRPGGGPSGPRMPLPDLPAGTWLDASKEELRTAAGACKKDSWCIQQLADAQAAAGDVHAAGLACLALDSELGEGYHECLFLASEAAVQHTSIDGLGVAFELASCSRFKAFSVSHLLELAAPPAPPPAPRVKKTWQRQGRPRCASPRPPAASATWPTCTKTTSGPSGWAPPTTTPAMCAATWRPTCPRSPSPTCTWPPPPR